MGYTTTCIAGAITAFKNGDYALLTASVSQLLKDVEELTEAGFVDGDQLNSTLSGYATLQKLAEDLAELDNLYVKKTSLENIIGSLGEDGEGNPISVKTYVDGRLSEIEALTTTEIDEAIGKSTETETE